jgi:hypothetical protein
MSLENLDKSMAEMTDWQWKKTMVEGCEMIDQFLKERERPIINAQVSKRAWPRVAENVPLLVEFSRRDSRSSRLSRLEKMVEAAKNKVRPNCD